MSAFLDIMTEVGAPLQHGFGGHQLSNETGVKLSDFVTYLVAVSCTHKHGS